MTAMLDPVTDDTVGIAVDLTIGQHKPDGQTWKTGACRQCRPDGSCPQLAWALSEQQAARQRAAHRTRTRTTPARASGGNPTAGSIEGDTA